MIPALSNNNTIPSDVISSPSVGIAIRNTQKNNTDQESKKPCKPKRPLSAYNLFFKHERERLLESNTERSEGRFKRKIGFGALAQFIAQKWKNTDDERREYFRDLAAEDMVRYKREKAEWKKAEKAIEKTSAGRFDT